MNPTPGRLEPRSPEPPERAQASGPRRTILHDPVLDAELADRGYAVIPFIDAAEVARLRAGYESLRPTGEAGLTIDFMRPDRSLMAGVETLLAPMWERFLPIAFIDHRPVVATFIVKHPDAGSAMGLHHEPTYVDPPHRTYNVWIPLVDVTSEADNGVLEIVPGTEHLPVGRVGFDTPPTFRRYEQLFLDLARPLDVAAGSALVYDTRMLHASRPNRSAVPRPAIAASIAPAEATLSNTVATGRRGRRIHHVDTGFFVDLHPHDVPAAVGDRYPLQEAVDECVDLPPEVVQTVLGLADRPQPRTVLPDGVAAAGAPRAELHPGPTPWLPTLGHDAPADLVAQLLAMGASTATPGTELCGATVSAVHGTVAAMAWRGPRRRARVGQALGAAVPRWTGATLVAVAPGCRVQLDRLVETHVATLEAPQVNAGACTPTHATTFEPGTTVALPPGPTVLWNGGPGPLLLLLRP